MTVPNLHIRRDIEVLERLKQAVSEFARREERMTRALEVRRSGVTWRYQSAMSGAEEGEKTQMAEMDATFGEQEKRARRVAANRQARVERASAQLLRSMPRKSREARGNWLANLQMRLRQAETARAEALRAAEAEAAAVAQSLGQECERVIALKREAKKSLPSYAKLSKEPAAPIDAPGGADGLRLVAEAATEAEAKIAAYRGVSVPRLLQFTRPDAKAAGNAAAEAVVKADRIYETVRQHGTQAHEAAQRAIQAEYERTYADISEQWTHVDEVEVRFQTKGRMKIEKQTPRILHRIKERETQLAALLASVRQRRLTEIRDGFTAQREEAARKYQAEEQQWTREEIEEWRSLEQQWAAEILPIYAEIRDIQADARALFPDWAEDWIEAWTPLATFPAGAKFAELKVDVKALAGALPKDPRLALPGPDTFSLPLSLLFPQQGSLLIEGKESAQGAAMGALNALVMRLLAGSPPGKASFTIIDPVGLGQNFAGLMYLADYEESLINRRIWTQQSQIEERLAELNEHIEKVIQMYLRNEYATITEYNEKAGSVAEKYHFLVIADFPAQFSETAARRLQSIATSGPRCGVFTFIQWDQRQSPPEGLAADELRRSSVCVERRGNGYFLPGFQPEPGTTLALDAPPEPELSAKLVHKTGKASVDSNRVEVPFSQISPPPGELWTNETTNELKIAIGRTGATKPQFLAIGKGTRQHALFAGKTGSGKSTLFHVIITNLALSCSPQQVEFYLIDFKKGVEFKCYAEKRLPHARVVAIESDREFAVSVLQRVDEELRRRGDMFRKLGVQDVAGYKRAGGTEDIPRSLLIIDEFQEFFVEDDAIAQNASLLFDRIVRQGRAFGIHVLLGSQTLGGAYTLARATLGQMVIRVALQCNEADAYLIMDDNNSAPRLLSRPGEGIYNDAAGAVEGNSPFQVVWLADEERDALLAEITAFGESRGIKNDGPIVFEGNAPADIRDNALLRDTLDKIPAEAPDTARTWMGAPNSIKGPTEAVFHRQSGNNLLVVGQREEAAMSILGLSLLALGAQYPAGQARFIFFQGVTDGPGPAFIEALAKGLPHEVTMVSPHEAASAINDIATELKTRMTSGAYGAGPVFVFVNGLHKFKKLRHEEDFSFSMSEGGADADPGAQFDELICEGSAYGIHLLVTVDAYSNVTRFISRKGISEFEMRVVFQMSANDSASLIDSPRGSGLGLHRALFFNEREGVLETFRPYALPGKAWIEEALGKLEGRRRLVVGD
jgi:S-DNA-T family DNA segregation ATPase FtsK/SpoIIIE